jgi:RNA polymerase sigma factor (sigma-70 family)
MANGTFGAVTRQVDRLFGEGTVAGLGESQLLERFLHRRDEAAFQAIVERHGPMVLGVCRRVLRDRHDAEDAFQATFLLLARKAGTIRGNGLLGPWLYRVAHRVAVRASLGSARRRGRERPDAEAASEAPAPDGSPADRDLPLAIHEELARLPEKYRVPVTLCYLEGLTHEEAAARLRWPVGTVKGRLSRARNRLRDRLAVRGLAAPVGLLAASLARDARAAMPPSLVDSTVQAATSVAAGKAATGLVSAAAVSLAEGVANAMFLKKIKTAALAALLSTSLIGAGFGAITRDGPRLTDRLTPPVPTDAAKEEVLAAQEPSDDILPTPVAQFAPTTAAAAKESPSPLPTATRRASSGPADKPAEPQLTPGISEERRHQLTRELEQIGDEEGLLEDDLIDARERLRELKRRTLDVEEKLMEADRSDPEGQNLLKRLEFLRSMTDEARMDYEKGRARLLEYRERADQLRRDLEAPAIEPVRVKPGDVLIVEVLEALPGRPIAGERQVRPDGTLSLGFYGEIPVAGLDLKQIKIKVIEHLRGFLNEEVLGLEGQDHQGRMVSVPAAQSDRVFVEVVWDRDRDRQNDDRIAELERKLDRALDELNRLRSRKETSSGRR